MSDTFQEPVDEVVGLQVEDADCGGEHGDRDGGERRQLVARPAPRSEAHGQHQRYEEEGDPYFAAARLWIDAIIDPGETREWISRGIAFASNNPMIPRFNPGVLQT